MHSECHQYSDIPWNIEGVAQSGELDDGGVPMEGEWWDRARYGSNDKVGAIVL